MADQSKESYPQVMAQTREQLAKQLQVPEAFQRQIINLTEQCAEISLGKATFKAPVKIALKMSQIKDTDVADARELFGNAQEVERKAKEIIYESFAKQLAEDVINRDNPAKAIKEFRLADRTIMEMKNKGVLIEQIIGSLDLELFDRSQKAGSMEYKRIV